MTAVRATMVALLMAAGLATASPAAAVPKAAAVSYTTNGPRTTASFDLAAIFANPSAADGKFGWENVTVQAEPGRTFARVRYPAGSYNPGAMKRMGKHTGGTGFRLKLGLPPSDTVRISYYLRFAPGFPFVKGGKLPGLGGGKGNTGGRIPDGHDGFSSRFMWREDGKGEVYAYLPCSKIWGSSLGRGRWQFRPGIWHHLEQTLTLNTPGKADGAVTVWLDGKRVFQENGLTFRHTPKLATDLLIFETFFGGDSADWATPTDTYADFAELTVSTGE